MENLTSEELMDKGNECFDNGEYGKAIDYYKEILDRGEENGELYFQLGAVYHAIGEFEDSLGYSQKALEFYPEDNRIYFNIGLAYD
ncbi:MAG: hypothetical protein ACLFR1_16185, partial [Spirochaetia bacterium]